MSEKEKIENKIQALRKARGDFVESTLTERQGENDKVGKLAGTKPARAELTFQEYSIIENRYNKPIAELKEQLRRVAGAEAEKEIPLIDDRLEALEREREDVLKTIEGQLQAIDEKIADERLKMIYAEKAVQAAKDNLNRIRFPNRAKDLLSPRYSPNDKASFMKGILSY